MRRELSWEAYGAIGEMIGASAVLVTLVYLALQMRQNTKALCIAARTTLQEAFSEVGSLLASSPGMAELYLKGCEDYRASSKADRLRFSSLLQNYIFSIEMMHRQTLEEAIATAEDPLGRLRILFSQPGVRDWWSRNSGLSRPAFVVTVESIITELADDEQYAWHAVQQGAATDEEDCVPIDPGRIWHGNHVPGPLPVVSPAQLSA